MKTAEELFVEYFGTPVHELYREPTTTEYLARKNFTAGVKAGMLAMREEAARVAREGLTICGTAADIELAQDVQELIATAIEQLEVRL